MRHFREESKHTLTPPAYFQGIKTYLLVASKYAKKVH